MAIPPVPPSDDEVERRLAALKSGAGSGAASPQPGDTRPRPTPRSPDPVLFGEVVEDAGARPAAGWRPASDEPGGSGSAGRPAGLGLRMIGWSVSTAAAGRLGFAIGLALVAFGGYLVLAEFVPGVAELGSLVMVVAGAALVWSHLAGRAGAWALNGGAVVAGFGAARLIADLATLPAGGWGTLGAGLALLALAGRRFGRREGVGWQAWAGGALVLFGGWGALGAVIPGFPTLGDLIVPLVLLLVGAAVLRRGLRSGG
jgi:hypothetical protein